jgi:hypothetical protein
MNAQTCESRVLPLPADPELQQMMLDEVFLDGWQLVSVDNQIAYLMRPAMVSYVPVAVGHRSSK